MVAIPNHGSHETPPAPRVQPGIGGRRAGLRGVIGLALMAAGGGAALAALTGFVLFVQALERREPVGAPRVDAIVALTGGSERIADAVELLGRGVADRLLITGVNERTSREEIMRQRPELRRLFSCCVDLDYLAQDTTGNAVQTRHWVRQRGFQSLLVVTSSYHMPRSLAELGHALPQVRLIPHPVVSETLHLSDWWREPATAKLLAVEYAKYVAALVRIQVGAGADLTAIAVQGAQGSAALHKS
jgi:uncharacterized SAM-binding protein YcdF (DUF218 family)